MRAVAEGDWRHRLRTVCRATRALAAAHPATYPLLLVRRSPGGRSRPITELLYTALLEAGVPEAAVPRLERLIATAALGYGAAEVTGRFSDPAGFPDEPELPAHRRLSAWLSEPDLDADFEADLDDLVRLVEARTARR